MPDIITADTKAESAAKDKNLRHISIRKINESKFTFRCL